MQSVLDFYYPLLDVEILGVNAAGFDSSNAWFTANSDLPWLQDVDSDGNSMSDVWEDWHVAYRDVIILDEENRLVGVFNLSTNDLSDPVNFNALGLMFVSAATGADFDLNGVVNGMDFLAWQRGGSPYPLSQGDLAIWSAEYGNAVLPLSEISAVPEPTTSALALAAICLAMSQRRRRTVA
jgi:hypothetical protein